MIADKHTIQVKGIGRVSRTPDTIIVWMHVESCDTDYKQAVDSAAQQLNLIRANLGTIGFAKEDLKTTSFDIHARHDNIRGKDNTYKEVFIGYEVRPMNYQDGWDNMSSENLDKCFTALCKMTRLARLLYDVQQFMDDSARTNEE